MIIHVDDILSAGDDVFKREVVSKMREKYIFGSVTTRNFEYTGMHIHQNDDFEIFIDQKEYAKKMDIFEYRKQNLENILEKDENRKIRKTTGQLSWISSQ